MEKERSGLKNKENTSSRCMTAVLRALVFSVLCSAAVMVSVYQVLGAAGAARPEVGGGGR